MDNEIIFIYFLYAFHLIKVISSGFGCILELNNFGL